MTAQTATSEVPPPSVALLTEGGRYGDVVGLGDEDLEVIYNLAYHQYQQGHYEDAEKTFRVLCFHDHLSDRFWLGLGAARQALKDYEGAVLAYSMIAELGHANPLAPLHAAECYMALGLYEEALSGIETAIEWADLAERPDLIRAYLEATLNALERAVAQDDADAPGSDQPGTA